MPPPALGAITVSSQQNSQQRAAAASRIIIVATVALLLRHYRCAAVLQAQQPPITSQHSLLPVWIPANTIFTPEQRSYSQQDLTAAETLQVTTRPAWLGTLPATYKLSITHCRQLAGKKLGLL